MTIYRLLKETAFDPEAVKRMANAFEETCRSLGVTANDEPQRERIARTVIDIAQAGERDPGEFRRNRRAVAWLGSSRSTSEKCCLASANRPCLARITPKFKWALT